MGSVGHNLVLFALTVVTPLVFGTTCFFNFIGMNNNTDIYESDTGTLSDKYYLEITPSGWVFSIWGVIYLWQALWIIYTLVNLFRKVDGGPLYTNPILQSPLFFTIYIINLGLNIAWLLLFDRQYLEASFGVLAALSATLYILLVLSYRALDQNMDVLVKQGREYDVWLTRMLVQNGLSIYGTWTTIATLLNMAMVMTYRSAHDISQRDACTVSLAFLGAILLVFLATDWFLLDRYTRYTFTPYFVLVFALAGSLAKNYDEGARNTIITIALLATAVVAAVVKAVLLFYRHCRHTKGGVIITSDGLKV